MQMLLVLDIFWAVPVIVQPQNWPATQPKCIADADPGRCTGLEKDRMGLERWRRLPSLGCLIYPEVHII